MAQQKTDKQHGSTPAAVTPPATQDSDPWADYSLLAEATKTKSGFPVLRSLAGQTVYITDLVQDEATKAFLASVYMGIDPKTFAPVGEAIKYAVPPTYAKKLAATLKARPANAPGIRVRLGEQKRGIGLS